MDKYIIITWPESQNLIDFEGFEENCCLINDSIIEFNNSFLYRYGSSAYFVNEKWFNENIKQENV